METQPKSGGFSVADKTSAVSTVAQKLAERLVNTEFFRTELQKIPQNWALTPVNGMKHPYRTGWQSETPLTREKILSEIESGRAKGYGIRTGKISGGIVAVDFDGKSAWELAQQLSGGDLPDTISFTSNRPGRHQRLYLIPAEYQDAIKTTKLKTGVTGDDGKPEQLEFRWDGHQSVLPPSVHPTTEQYVWLNSPEEIEIAIAPMWVIEQMLKPKSEPKTTPKLRQPANSKWTATDYALSYLNALSPYRADDYDEWLAVGMALHSADDSLLSEWENWSRQSPKYESGCCEKKWKSFKSDGVSLGTLGHMAKQDGWKSPFEKAENGLSSLAFKNRQNNALSLRDSILKILHQNQSQSRRNEELIKLAKISHISTKDVKELAESLESEVDLVESRSERKAEIENLLKAGKYQLRLQEYLVPSVAQPLEKRAKWMGTSSAAMLVTLYAVIGSLMKVGSRLELIKATDFYAIPITYTGIVNESGTGKTPAQKTMLKPLFALQSEAEAEHKENLLQHKQDCAEWQKKKEGDPPTEPVPREYYITDATCEAIALIHSQQPEFGFLGWFDELASLFKSYGEYKGGKGADAEKILSGRDGTGFKVHRASGKRLVVEQSAYSITGGMQPSVLKKLMGDFSDANGQWARFLWTVMQVQPAPYPDDAIPFDVTDLLKGIYRRINNLPPLTYKLSTKAQALYRNWYNQLDELKLNESRQGLRAVYSKMKGDTGTLALLLHVFNGCAEERGIPDIEVSEETMSAAIKLAKYHIGQVKLIHSEGDAANGELAAIHTKIIQLSERKGWLKASDVRDIDRQTKKKFTADDIRKQFQELEASGFGRTKGEGTRLIWNIHSDDDDHRPSKTQDNSGQFLANSGQFLANSGHFLANSGQTQDSTKFAKSIEDITICSSLSKNSGQTQDSTKGAESIEDITFQEFNPKTQDIQDTFSIPEKTMVIPQESIEANNREKSVLSCPEFFQNAENASTVVISANEVTQDTCPEFVLSCPESALSCPEFQNQAVENGGDDREATLNYIASVMPVVADEWSVSELDELRTHLNSFDLNTVCKTLTREQHNRISKMVLAQPKTQIKFGEYSGTIEAKSKEGQYFITWDSFSKRVAQQNKIQLPGALKVFEFDLVSG